MLLEGRHVSDRAAGKSRMDALVLAALKGGSSVPCGGAAVSGSTCLHTLLGFLSASVAGRDAAWLMDVSTPMLLLLLHLLGVLLGEQRMRWGKHTHPLWGAKAQLHIVLEAK